jgi:hypothetical protein
VSSIALGSQSRDPIAQRFEYDEQVGLNLLSIFVPNHCPVQVFSQDLQESVRPAGIFGVTKRKHRLPLRHCRGKAIESREGERIESLFRSFLWGVRGDECWCETNELLATPQGFLDESLILSVVCFP